MRALLCFSAASCVAALVATSPLLAADPSSGKMNPDLSLDGLFAASQFNQSNPLVFSSGHDPRKNGFNIQQVELSLGANVDPYFRGDANLVLTPDGIEIEEAYGTTLDLPWNLQAKAGQFFTAFGRHNPSHPHTWDFANKPLVLGRFFGGDGLRNPGAQLSWITPLPWYSELIVSGQNSTGDTAKSFRPDGTPAMRTFADSVALAKLNQFFALSDELSVNLGTSYLIGPNAETLATKRTQIYGLDLFAKFRKIDSLSFITLQAEIARRIYGRVADSDAKDWGWYSQLNFRLPEPMHRWHVGLRYDWVSDKSAPVATAGTTTLTDGTVVDRDLSKRSRISPVVTFYPSEFSKLRLQYDYDKPQSWKSAQHVVTAQFEFLIGAHGAHKF